MLGGVHAQQRQVRAPAHAFFADTQFNAFAGGGDRVHAGNRRRVVDKPAHAGIETDHLSQPVKGDFFQFG